MNRFVASLAALLTVGSIASAQEYKIRLPNVDPPLSHVGDMTYPNHTYAMMRTFKDSLEGLSGGRIAVELYPSGTLGDLRENLEAVQAGILEAATPNEGTVSGFFPKIQLTTIPYVFPNAVVAWDVMDGEWGQQLLNEMAETTGIRAIAVGENAGFRIWANNIRPVTEPKDMSGLKIRTMEITAHQEMVSSLGALPTAIPWLEVYNALQTGVVDGAELPVIGTLQQNLQEVLKYATIDQHVYSLVFIVVNEDWYQALPPDLREAITIAGRQASVAGRGVSQTLVSDVIDEFRKRGVEITTASPEQIAAFREAAQPKVLEWMESQFGEEEVNKFLDAVKAAEARLAAN
ncbi:DctP family TRAP transporter solute-binding subunit [Chelativorans sp. SCAU2101]|uniref:DctP family TRAP transporter solute-binding subunit n=1 Tax=Chelativorans petroleitrophicus TaxID=2975484 RepID=A0A9X2XAE0_9HYPH|nr:DctP family TRAP transporter solute-binding subunit [Chelativorans petroleitrophicus]MCT8992277.1 DctP family TRAP transporter solute-binding subunit [Chelativorans petroleitrophicus]